MFKRASFILSLFCLLIAASGAAQAQDVLRFSANQDTYAPGGSLSLSWQVTGVDLVIIEVYTLDQPDIPLQVIADLPVEGSTSIFIPANTVGGVRLVLWAANRPGFPAPVTMYAHLRSAVIELQPDAPCQPSFRFPGKAPSNCPPASQYPIQAAYQPFENGFMLWRADSGEVWVLEKSGVVLRYPEDVYALTPDNPVTTAPPPGYSAPAHGFGRVWGNFSVVRRALGWALGVEVSYTMTIQFTRYPFPPTPYFYMTLPDGNAVRIVGDGHWLLETP